MLQILPAGATTPHSAPLISLNAPIELAKPFAQRPPTHNGSSSSASQQAETALTEPNSVEMSSATQTSSSDALSAESNTKQTADSSSEPTEELEAVLLETMTAVQGETVDEHGVHRKMLQMNRNMAAAAQHTNQSSSDSSDGPIRLEPSEKLSGMIASSSRAFGKPGK